MSCWNPFKELRCNPEIYATCCPPWLDSAAYYGQWFSHNGPALEASPWKVWNNQVFQQLRKAILDDDFKFCLNCSKRNTGQLENDMEPWMKPILEVPPRRIWLEHDRHCNLKCPSCRSRMIHHEGYQNNRDIKIIEICEEFLPTAEWLVVMTSGEPLVSQSTLEIISWVKKYPELEMELFTNGLLIPEKWHLMPEEQTSKLTISIDAATKETYENVRRPGKWERLMRSLEFIKEKRKNGLISRFQVNFVIQTANFHEIPKFVKLGADYHATNCFFAPIIKIHHTDEEFAEMNVSDPAHPRHKELLKVLKNPMLKHNSVWCPFI